VLYNIVQFIAVPKSSQLFSVFDYALRGEAPARGCILRSYARQFANSPTSALIVWRSYEH
jgi:hypothetical protein